MQERLESTRVGQILISVFLIVTLAAIVMTNTHDSKLKSEFVRVGQPYLNALGLDQAWNVFAPDPRQEVIDFQARVRYADGSSDMWTYPRGDDVIGVYWDYRWRKWVEHAIADVRRDQLWKPTAAYVARQMSRPGRRPVEVKLVRRFYAMTPPGELRRTTQFNEYEYYTYRVPPAVNGGGAR